jgi:hypothetical protein
MRAGPAFGSEGGVVGGALAARELRHESIKAPATESQDGRFAMRAFRIVIL